MIAGVAPRAPYRSLTPDLFGTNRRNLDCTLGKTTVIYGHNGSGKTSFSEYLRQLTKGTDEPPEAYWIHEPQANGSAPVAGDFNGQIHVFNRYYVKDELRLFLDGASSSKGILKLGAKNIENKGQADDMESAVGRNRARMTVVTKSITDTTNEVKTCIETTKHEVIDTLKAFNAEKYNTTRFTVTHAKRLLEENLATPSEMNLHESQHILPQTSPPSCLPITLHFPNVNVLQHRILEITSRTIDAKPIHDLTEDPSLSTWVDAGTRLHHAGDECKFCGDGILSNERMVRLLQHFSDSMRNLEEDCRELLRDLAAAQIQTSSVVTEIRRISLNDLAPEHRASFESARARELDKAEAITHWISTAEGLVSKRQSSLLSPIDSTPLGTTTPEDSSLSGMQKIIEESNSQAETHAFRRQQAFSTVEQSVAARHSGAYHESVERARRLKDLRERLEARLNLQEGLLRRLRDSLKEIGSSCDQINSDLQERFGHQALKLIVTSDGHGYEVHRNRVPAAHLSEGEQNAIALAYFLRSLEADDVTAENDIVVIDDAITSFDSDAIYAAHGWLSTRLSGFQQVIILTHSHEHLRLNIVKYARKNSVTQADTGLPDVSFLQMTCTERDASGERTSRLSPIPERIVQHQSEYHYLFWQVASNSLDPSTTDFGLLGNAARRLLEGFVSFKAPGATDLASKVNSTISSAPKPENGEIALDAAFQERVLRFLHGESHRENPNPMASPVLLDPRAELLLVLHLMHRCDREHTEGLAKSIGLDKRTLRQALRVQSSPRNELQ